MSESDSMTVAQLIEELKKQPQDADIFFRHDGWYHRVRAVEYDLSDNSVTLLKYPPR